MGNGTKNWEGFQKEVFTNNLSLTGQKEENVIRHLEAF